MRRYLCGNLCSPRGSRISCSVEPRASAAVLKKFSSYSLSVEACLQHTPPITTSCRARVKFSNCSCKREWFDWLCHCMRQYYLHLKKAVERLFVEPVTVCVWLIPYLSGGSRSSWFESLKMAIVGSDDSGSDDVMDAAEEKMTLQRSQDRVCHYYCTYWSLLTTCHVKTSLLQQLLTQMLLQLAHPVIAKKSFAGISSSRRGWYDWNNWVRGHGRHAPKEKDVFINAG